LKLFFFVLDQSHELLPKEHGNNAPSIVIHTCEDPTALSEADNALRQKLIKPTLVQTRRPPNNETNEHI